MNHGPSPYRVLLLATLATFAGCGGEPAGAQPPSAQPGDDAGVGGALPSAYESAVNGKPGEDAPNTPDLGPLPSELDSLVWPTRPQVTNEVTATTAEELEAAVSTPGTRVRLRGVEAGEVRVTADDIEIIADESSSLGRLYIAQSVRRVRVEGGRWAGVKIEVPADFTAGKSFHPELMAEDVWLEGMKVVADEGIAYEIRGKRIAIVDSDVTAELYSVWCGDTGHFQTEDLILYGNVFRSKGPESTVRLVSVLRSAAVSNVMSNTYKHNYRVHGVSDLNLAVDNLLVGTGVMLGTMEGDRLGTVWFDDNVMHHDAPDLFNPSPSSIATLFARRNTAYAQQHAVFYEGELPPGWVLAENQVAPYQDPPSY